MADPAPWDDLPTLPPDAIIGLNARYEADPNPGKMKLSQGLYRDADGAPYVMPSVGEAERLLLSLPSGSKDYLPILGRTSFTRRAQRLLFGSTEDGDRTVLTVHTPGGSAARRVGRQPNGCLAAAARAGGARLRAEAHACKGALGMDAGGPASHCRPTALGDVEREPRQRGGGTRRFR